MKDKIYSVLFISMNIPLFISQYFGIKEIMFNFGLVDLSSKIASLGLSIIQATPLIYAILFVCFRKSGKCLAILTFTSIFLCFIFMLSCFLFFSLAHCITDF